MFILTVHAPGTPQHVYTEATQEKPGQTWYFSSSFWWNNSTLYLSSHLRKEDFLQEEPIASGNNLLLGRETLEPMRDSSTGQELMKKTSCSVSMMGKLALCLRAHFSGADTCGCCAL